MIQGTAFDAGSEITGGQFKDGFIMGFGSRYLQAGIEKFTTYGATWDTPETSDAVYKPDDNLIGNRVYCPRSCDVPNADVNTIGSANKVTPANADLVSLTVDSSKFSPVSFKESSLVSRVLSHIPGFNSGGVFHDVAVGTFGRAIGSHNWGAVTKTAAELFYNQGTIAPLIGANYYSLGLGQQLSYVNSAREY